MELERRKDFLKNRPDHEVKAITTLFKILLETGQNSEVKANDK